MNVYRNESLIKRNARIAQITMLAGLAVLGGGMWVSFTQSENYTLLFGALGVGFIVAQIGMYFMNRWGRKPRPDEQIEKALKGLDRKFSLYSWNTPVSHLLVGPTGLWILLPYYQRGTISYSKGRWRQSGGGLFYQYLKLFAQESLGRPDLELNSEIAALEKYLKEKLPDEKLPPIQGALVFTDDRTVIHIPEDENPPAETVKLADLKKVVGKGTKGKTLSVEKIKQVDDSLLAA